MAIKNYETRESYKAKTANCFCTNHTGKMSGVISISTSVALNARCQARAKNKESICAFCFAAAMLEQYSDLGAKLARNTETLTREPLEPSDIPIINKEKSKRDFDKYIKSCNVKKAGVKGSRPEAWAELKALEVLVKAARG